MREDTIKLLHECDAGVKMGVKSIDDVLDYIESNALKKYLTDSKQEHEKLKQEIETKLNEYNEEEQNPSVIATKMSSMKVNMKLKMNRCDKVIADLMTDGCNMGVKSLNKYLNQYENAEKDIKEITMRLIKLEERLAEDIRQFL